MLFTNSDFGIPQSDWNAAKEQARNAMIVQAGAERTISYTDLVAEITAVHFQPHDKRLDHFLAEIASEEDAAGRGMLTVVVVHKTGDMRPGPGFFELAKHLGRETGDTDAFWILELRRVFDVWGRGQISD